MINAILTKELSEKSEYFRFILEDTGNSSIGDVISVKVPDGVNKTLLKYVIEQPRIIIDLVDVDEYTLLRDYFMFTHIKMHMGIGALAKWWNNNARIINLYKVFDPIIILTKSCSSTLMLSIPDNTDTLSLTDIHPVELLSGSARTIVLDNVRMRNDVLNVPKTCTSLTINTNHILRSMVR